ncbi:hypothetical protein LOZ58_006269 [Ophidiomyces ophidiicola]|nr:hypothetical protein LOZ58_006269 [Ophidiomyces ophidiicola]
MADLEFETENTTQAPPTDADLKKGFVLKAPPCTDLWAKPPATVRSNAPTVYKALPLSRFQRARVRVSAQWSTLYDQGGLVMILHRDDARKWIKTGIEFVNGKPYLSTVGKDNWADWSLAPVPGDGREAILEMVKDKGVLWVYSIEQGEDGETRIPMRELTWAFAEEQGVECWVGMYACRPGKEGGELEVTFRDFELEVTAA